MLLLLVPTMIWTYLRVPRHAPLVEFLCLLPLAIPAIVLVVGIAPIYQWMGQHLGAIGGSPLTLAFIDIILVLPFAHRAIDAGLRAHRRRAPSPRPRRSLGAGWPRVIFQIIVPNIRGGDPVRGAVLTVALVLGEFTISSLLNYDTLQVVINLLGKRDAFVAVAVSLAALIFAFVLLFVIARRRARRPRSGARDRSPTEEPAVDDRHGRAGTATGRAPASPSSCSTCTAGTARSTRSTA